MGRIENYDNDSGISSLDRLFGTSYEGMLDGRPVYKTKNYLMGEVISKITSEVASAGDRWSSISYKFTPQMMYDLGDANSGVLDLYSVSQDTYTKNWILIPGVPGKYIVINNIVYIMKKGSVDFDVNYNTSLSHVLHDGVLYTFFFRTDVYNNQTGNFMLHVSGQDPIAKKEGSPFLFNVTNSSLATQGDNEFGIWIEYRYFDFNLDFNG